MSVIEPLRPRGSTSGGAAHVGAYRFGIGAGGSDWRWHAVDLQVVGPRMADAVARGGQRGDVEVFSVCGTRAELVRRLGQFTYGSRWLSERRCERCGWVVALNRGTVEAEIERTWVRPATVIPGWYGRSSLPFLPTWRRAVTRSPDTAQTCWRTPHDTGRRRSCVCGAVKNPALQRFTGTA